MNSQRPHGKESQHTGEDDHIGGAHSEYFKDMFGVADNGRDFGEAPAQDPRMEPQMVPSIQYTTHYDPGPAPPDEEYGPPHHSGYHPRPANSDGLHNNGDQLHADFFSPSSLHTPSIAGTPNSLTGTLTPMGDIRDHGSHTPISGNTPLSNPSSVASGHSVGHRSLESQLGHPMELGQQMDHRMEASHVSTGKFEHHFDMPVPPLLDSMGANADGNDSRGNPEGQQLNSPALPNHPGDPAFYSRSNDQYDDRKDTKEDAQLQPPPKRARKKTNEGISTGSGESNSGQSTNSGPGTPGGSIQSSGISTDSSTSAMSKSATGTPASSSKSTPGQALGSKSQLEIKKMTDVKSRACDECRRRKTACYYLNSETPKCFRCQMEDIDCTFSARSRSGQGNTGAGPHRTAPISQRSVPKQLPAGVVGPVEDYSQLPGRSLLKKTLSLQHPRSSFSVGQHGLWDQRVLESITLDKSNQARVSSNLSLRKVGSDAWFMIRNEGGQGDWVRDCDEIERTVYPYGRALVNAFFMYFQPEYPVLHEKIFVEKYLRTYRELMPALLGSVYLLGMRWWNHSAELATVPRPDHIMPGLYDMVLTNFFKSSGGSSLSLIQAGLLLLQCSYSDTRHLSICSVINAAALRLALNRNCLHWKLPRWEINLRLRLSWATYSQSTWISLMESIPPLINDNSWFLAPLNADMFDTAANEPGYNDALFIHLNKLSLIVHDMHNLLSSRLLLMYSTKLSAQQAMANNANVNANLTDASSPFSFIKPSGTSQNSPSSSVGSPVLTRDNSPFSSGPKTSSTSTATTPLQATSAVLSASGGGGSSSNTSPEMFAEALLELIKPIQLRLHEWYQALPPALVNIESDNPPGNFSLRIAYIAAEVTLHRFIIRVISSKSAPALDPGMTAFLRTSARERLDLANELLNSLRPQHLHQFWYFISSQQIAVIGVFAALMYTTSENPGEAQYYSNLLATYLARVRLFSDNEVMAAALRTLRSSIAGVPGLEF